MKRYLALLLCLLLIVSCFAGCKKETAEDTAGVTTETTLADQNAAQIDLTGKELKVYISMEENSEAYLAFEEQTALFEQQTGAVVSVANISSGYDIANVLMGDVFYADSLSQVSIHQTDALELSQYAAGSDISGRLYPVYANRMSAYAANEGGLIALPADAYPMAFWYNTEVFASAGITEAPASMEEFEAVCDKLVAAGYVPVAVEEHDALTLFANHVERYVGENTLRQLVNSGNWSANTDAVAACQKLVDWVGKGYFDREQMSAWLPLISMGQQSAMLYTNEGDRSLLDTFAEKDLKLDAFAYPTVSGAAGALQVDFASYCVNAATQVPELAWAYLYFMTTGEADLAMAQAADRIPSDKSNTAGIYPNAVQMLASATEICNHESTIRSNSNVDLKEVVLNIYAGAYADGAAVCAALDGLY